MVRYGYDGAHAVLGRSDPTKLKSGYLAPWCEWAGHTYWASAASRRERAGSEHACVRRPSRSRRPYRHCCTGRSETRKALVSGTGHLQTTNPCTTLRHDGPLECGTRQP
eukprot:40016-Pleurochrysis_carterae.AAC.1